MDKTLHLEVITPEKLALKDDAEFVVLPGFQGELGVLPGHAPLLAQLGAGALRIAKDGQVRLFAVSGGFAEVQQNRIAVFAETAEMAQDIDVERARLAADRAKKELSSAVDPLELAKAQSALQRALLRLRISEGMHRVHMKGKV